MGTGRPGVVAVARLAGVAPSTVSNTFNRPQVVSEQLRDRVLRAAAQLEYGGADPAGRRLRGARAGALGVVIRERLAYAFHDAAAVRLLQGVSEVADPHQLALVIIPAYPEAGSSAGPAVRNAAVDGLILYSLAGDDPLVAAARHRHLPSVVVDSPTGDQSDDVDGFGFVGIDERAAGAEAVGHLLGRGHVRIAILSSRLAARDRPGPADLRRQAHARASVPRGRLAGAELAITGTGLRWADVPVVQCQTSSVEGGRAGMHTLLDLAPQTTAVFAFSDPLAVGARAAASERGLAVPEELAILGFDDSIAGEHGLSTIHQPLREKGRVAARLVLDRAGGLAAGGPVILPTRLVERSSTARSARSARSAQSARGAASLSRIDSTGTC